MPFAFGLGLSSFYISYFFKQNLRTLKIFVLSKIIFHEIYFSGMINFKWMNNERNRNINITLIYNLKRNQCNKHRVLVKVLCNCETIKIIAFNHREPKNIGQMARP